MAVTWQRQDHEAATADFPPVSQSQQVNQESNRAQAPQIKETLTLEGQETHVHLNWSMRLLPPLKTSMFSTKGSDNTTHTHHKLPHPRKVPQTHRDEVYSCLEPSRTFKIPCQLQVLIAGGQRGKGTGCGWSTHRDCRHKCVSGFL